MVSITKRYWILYFILLNIPLFGQTVEAEIDTSFKYQFKSVSFNHNKSILVDAAHNTIYSVPNGKITSREMFRIIESDGFDIDFTEQTLDSVLFNITKPDLLIIQGMPNNKIKLQNKDIEETLYLSPLKNEEVEAISKYVFDGGGLLLFLSHFPGGSGALPLLEALNVKFRDGYAFQSKYHTSKSGICGHFLMNEHNKMLNLDHSIFETSIDKNTIPNNVRFYCGAAIFRNPDDNILNLPANTINNTPTESGDYLKEVSDSYAGMIGFNYGSGRVVISTDQGIFRSLNIIQGDELIAVTIHDSDSDNAGLLVNILRWLTKLQ